MVLDGDVPFTVSEVDLSVVPETKTKVMMILGNPDLAFDARYVFVEFNCRGRESEEQQ